MSQDANVKKYWEGLVDHFSMASLEQQDLGDGKPGDSNQCKRIFDSTTAIFSVEWESKTETELFRNLGQALAVAALQGVVAYAGGAMTGVGAAILASQGVISMKPISGLFKKAKQNAKFAGQLLACALALKMPFKTQTISLVGFSLGGQVIKSCLKTLYYLYDRPCDPPHPRHQMPQELVHNVTFFAAATHFRKNLDKYRRIFRYMVNGQAKNVYSKGDYVLHLYTLCEIVWDPLGRNPLILRKTEDENDVVEQMFGDDKDNVQDGMVVSREMRKCIAQGKNGPVELRFGHDLIQNFDVSRNVVTKRVDGGMSHVDYQDRIVQTEIFMNIDQI